MGPEWQLKFPGDFRPVLAKYVPRHVIGDAEADAAGRRTKTTRISGMVEVAQRLGAYCPKPFGIIRHELARIALSHKRVRHRMANARLRGALSQAVVARILLEE